MAAKESYRNSQESELVVLKSIFENVIDLRPTQEKDKWIPLDIKIKLEPQRGSAVNDIYCSCFLRIVCPKNYPKVLPKLYIEDAKSLSNADITTLLNQLNKEAYSLKGEVCIFELCQLVQAFLHERNLPPKGSFYDEMLARKLKKDQDEKKQREEMDQKWRQQLNDVMIKQQQQEKKENRTRRSTLNDSPLRHLSSESSNSECKMFANSEVCEEHKKTETLHLSLERKKKIFQGACLGHSLKGCINYSGIDYETGKLYYITEWNVKQSLLDARNLKVCEFIETINNKVQALTRLHHRNIVAYEGVLCNQENDSVQVILIQEFILGISVCSMSGGCFNWNVESVSSMAKGILEGLIFLHNNGISHGNLCDSSVFLESAGVIKISDYSVISYLQEIICGISLSADLPSLGSLLESLIPTPHLEMRNFINECKSERTLSASNLLEHPFLYNILITVDSQAQNDEKVASNYPPPILQQNINLTNVLAPIVTSTHSRLDTEFEMINFIGKGAYGDVLKVRNILDNRQYAIKRIPLSSLNKQLYRKMTREVELLSRLNHENIVRYYNSWLETQTAPIPELEEDSDDDGLPRIDTKKDLIRTHSGHKNRIYVPSTDDDDSMGNTRWNAYISDSSSDSEYDDGDGIEFVDSQGRVVKYDDDDDDEDEPNDSSEKDGKGDGLVAPKKNTILYIQMEFCEKSTLRSAIDDDNLYENKERIKKLFREIVEGLSHIHQQGMIHRDLKCENIFLDSKDHIKLGDFGLATTSVLALQYQNNETNQSLQIPKMSYGDSHTGQVGTALYCAPELSQKACKSTYNQKVDIYSLGIIFFEMNMPRFSTGMERIQTLLQIRQPEIVIPSLLLNDEKCKNEVEILRILLNHNPSLRPSSEELLQSELMPAAKVEASEIQEMFRQVLANPQTRSYKNLITRILNQEPEKQLTSSAYHGNMIFLSSVFENVKLIIEKIFRKHSAIDVSTPLLMPYSKSQSGDPVRLMTHSGLIVSLPTNLRTAFLRLIAQNLQISSLRRYAITRTYHERKTHNQHPKQAYECVFDVVTPTKGNYMVDAELLAIMHEIISKFDILKQRNVTFRINHTSLVRAIFLYYSVPAINYRSILDLVKEYLSDKNIRNKKQLIASVALLLPAKNGQSVCALVDSLLVTDIPISNLSSTNLKVIIKGRGDATNLAKGAIRELETVISLSQAMGVNRPIHLCVNFTMGFDCSRGSILWNVTGETKPGKKQIMAYGGRFDHQLEDFQKSCQKLRELHCAGFTIAMDKLLMCLNQSNEHHSVVDLVVFVAGLKPPVKDICNLMNSLWAADIKCCFIESACVQVDDDVARNLGANHICVLGENGCIRVKSWLNDRYQEKSVSRAEAVDYLKKNLSPNFHLVQEPNHLIRHNSIGSMVNIENVVIGSPAFEIVFIANEKFNVNKRKRLENQIEQKIENVLQKFTRKETFIIFAIELDVKQIRALLSCIDPNPKEQSQSEFEAVLKGFPKNKQNYLQEIYDEITDKLSSNKNSIIIGLFGIPDSYYRLIL